MTKQVLRGQLRPSVVDFAFNRELQPQIPVVHPFTIRWVPTATLRIAVLEFVRPGHGGSAARNKVSCRLGNPKPGVERIRPLEPSTGGEKSGHGVAASRVLHEDAPIDPRGAALELVHDREVDGAVIVEVETVTLIGPDRDVSGCVDDL